MTSVLKRASKKSKPQTQGRRSLICRCRKLARYIWVKCCIASLIRQHFPLRLRFISLNRKWNRKNMASSSRNFAARICSLFCQGRMACDCFFRLILKVSKSIPKASKCVLSWGFPKHIEDKINLSKEDLFSRHFVRKRLESRINEIRPVLLFNQVLWNSRSQKVQMLF